MIDLILAAIPDTIHHIDSVLVSSNYELLTQVQSFYDSALNHIEWIMIAGLALAGVIIPLYIYFWQRITFRKVVRSEIEKFKEEIIKENEKINSLIMGNIFHLQGNTNLIETDYEDALYDFLTTYDFYMKSGLPNALRNLKNIHDNIKGLINRLDPMQIGNVFVFKIESSPRVFITKLKKHESYKYLSSEVDELKSLLSKADIKEELPEE